MPSTVYKGDLAEVSFGHETGIVLTHGHWGSLDFSISTSGDVSTISVLNGAGNFFYTGFLNYPEGMLAGSRLRVIGGGNYSSDDFTKGHIYTIVDNYGTTIKVTPAMQSTGVSDTGDVIIIESLGTPTLDPGMTYSTSAAASDESVLTDQFVGLAATLTVPETTVEVLRSHVVGIGRNVVVQEPQKIVNSGGSLETMMHSARWFYYALGAEAVVAPSALTSADSGIVDDGADVKAIAAGDTYVELAAAASGGMPSVGQYIVIVDNDAVLTPYEDEPTSPTKWTGTQTQFHTSIRTEMRRVIGIDQTVGTARRIYVDDPFCFDHAAKDGSAGIQRINKLAVDDASTNGSPNFDTAAATYGTITNRQKRAMWTGSHIPSFSLEQSFRTHDVNSYGTGGYAGSQANNAPGAANDSKQLTRVFRGCKVKSFELKADAEAAVMMKVDFDALFCYTDTGRLENSNKGDRYTAHRMFENIANGPSERKLAGIAPNTEKPFLYYNGTITAFGIALAQITNFSLTGSNGIQTLYTVRGNPLAESRNSAGESLEQVPFAGSRNPSLQVEGKVEYEMTLGIIVTDPLLFHEFRTNRTHGYSEPITLHLVKNGAGSDREEVYVVIDDYIISEAPLQIPEDKGPIKSELKIKPKHVKVIAYDTLLHS